MRKYSYKIPPRSVWETDIWNKAVQAVIDDLKKFQRKYEPIEIQRKGYKETVAAPERIALDKFLERILNLRRSDPTLGGRPRKEVNGN